MADSTTLNGIEARHIHRSNAPAVLDDAESMLKYYRDRLMILAAMAPMNVDEGDGPMTWDFYVRREVDGIFDEMLAENRTAWQAQYILDFPDECVDDYDKEP